jgi:hypothetical protein
MLILDGHARRVDALATTPGGSTPDSASHDGTVGLRQAKAL